MTTTTNNSLKDIINWLKNNNMVFLYAGNNYKCYYNKESVTNNCDFNNTKLIYIDICDFPSLIDEDEWPWYIKNEGFIDYKNIDVLPTDVYHYKL
jgi:hypothetical protein